MDCATGPPHRSAELYWKRPDDPISLTDRHESASARQTVVSESGVRKHRVRVRFYQELGDFLAPRRRGRDFEVTVNDGTTTKALIEHCGVPHGEVDLLLVDGESVDFAHKLRDGQRVSVYPVFESFDISGLTRVRPAPLRAVRFLVDARAPGSPRIQALHRSLGGLASDDHSDRRIMWLAGQGTDEETVRTGWYRVKNVISQLGEASRTVLDIPDRAPLVVSGSCQAALMFGSFAPDIREDDILPLAHTMVELSSSDAESAAMAELRRSVATTAFNSPWSQGYDLAEALHEELEMKYARGGCVDIAGMVEELGIEVIEMKLSEELAEL